MCGSCMGLRAMTCFSMTHFLFLPLSSVAQLWDYVRQYSLDKQLWYRGRYRIRVRASHTRRIWARLYDPARTRHGIHYFLQPQFQGEGRGRLHSRYPLQNKYFHKFSFLICESAWTILIFLIAFLFASLS